MGLKSLDEVKALEYSVAISEYSAQNAICSVGKSPRDASFPFQEDPENVLYIQNHLYRYSS